MFQERRFAIVIGINDYKHNKPLHYCVNDAKSVEKVLIERCNFKPEDIFLLTSSIDESITEITGKYKEALRTISDNFRESEDSILFYFAGHGNYKKEESNILFHDSEYPIKEVFSEISVLNPKVQTYIIDSCNSGGKVLTRGEEEPFLPQDYLIGKYIESSDGAMLLYACGSNQKARETEETEHGLLTFSFLNALDNKALYDEDGILTPSIIQDYVLKQTSKMSNLEQTPVVENRISGIYPFATITKEEQTRAAEVETMEADKTKPSVNKQKPLVTLPKQHDFSGSLQSKMNFDSESRLKLQEFMKEKLSQKLDEVLDSFTFIRPNYKLDSFTDFYDLNYIGLDKLIEKLVVNAKKNKISPLDDIFHTINRQKTRHFAERHLDRYSAMFKAFAPDEPEYDLEHTIDSGNKYIETNVKIISSNKIDSTSFGCGFIIYQSKWGIIVTTLIFKIDWDGEKDNIIDTIIQNNYSFLIQDETYITIEEMEVKEFSDIANTIATWNAARRDELETFVKNSISSTKKI